ncbi:hypothetical protein CCP3SC5AM1_50012 [Gammaproteobacteria bacterium]
MPHSGMLLQGHRWQLGFLYHFWPNSGYDQLVLIQVAIYVLKANVSSWAL